MQPVIFPVHNKHWHRVPRPLNASIILPIKYKEVDWNFVIERMALLNCVYK